MLKRLWCRLRHGNDVYYEFTDGSAHVPGHPEHDVRIRRKEQICRKCGTVRKSMDWPKPERAKFEGEVQ